MPLKKTLIALAAAAALATPTIAATPTQDELGYSSGSGVIAILIGLLLPAVQKVR